MRNYPRHPSLSPQCLYLFTCIYLQLFYYHVCLKSLGCGWQEGLWYKLNFKQSAGEKTDTPGKQTQTNTSTHMYTHTHTHTCIYTHTHTHNLECVPIYFPWIHNSYVFPSFWSAAWKEDLLGGNRSVIGWIQPHLGRACVGLGLGLC